jgi:hypothetical protein
VASGRGLSPPLRPDMTRAAGELVQFGERFIGHKFLIARHQITPAKNHLNQSMTMEQLLEAEQKAAKWMRKMSKIPPSSIENPSNASTA